MDVKLQPSAAQRRAIPSAAGWGLVAFKMLIDTGADHTAVDVAKIAPWNLYPATFYLSQSMGSLNTVQVFELAISIFGSTGQLEWNIDPLLVTARTGSPFDGLPYHGVIGRDVLDQGLLVYNGASSHCTLGY